MSASVKYTNQKKRHLIYLTWEQTYLYEHATPIDSTFLKVILIVAYINHLLGAAGTRKLFEIILVGHFFFFFFFSTFLHLSKFFLERRNRSTKVCLSDSLKMVDIQMLVSSQGCTQFLSFSVLFYSNFWWIFIFWDEINNSWSLKWPPFPWPALCDKKTNRHLAKDLLCHWCHTRVSETS